MIETKSFAFKQRKSSCLCPSFSHMSYLILYLILFLYPVAQQYFTTVTKEIDEKLRLHLLQGCWYSTKHNLILHYLCIYFAIPSLVSFACDS